MSTPEAPFAEIPDDEPADLQEDSSDEAIVGLMPPSISEDEMTVAVCGEDGEEDS